MNFQSPELGQIQESWTLKEHVQICCIPQQKVLRNMTASKCISVQAVGGGGHCYPGEKERPSFQWGNFQLPLVRARSHVGPLTQRDMPISGLSSLRSEPVSILHMDSRSILIG